MDFIEKMGDTITSKGKEAAQKAKDIAEMASLKGQISVYEDVMRKNYLEIGRLYYEHYGDLPEDEFVDPCKAIKSAKKGVGELQKQLNHLKGI